MDSSDDYDFEAELPQNSGFGGFKFDTYKVAVGVVAVAACIGYWLNS